MSALNLIIPQPQLIHEFTHLTITRHGPLVSRVGPNFVPQISVLQLVVRVVFEPDGAAGGPFCVFEGTALSEAKSEWSNADREVSARKRIVKSGVDTQMSVGSNVTAKMQEDIEHKSARSPKQTAIPCAV